MWPFLAYVSYQSNLALKIFLQSHIVFRLNNKTFKIDDSLKMFSLNQYICIRVVLGKGWFSNKNIRLFTILMYKNDLIRYVCDKSFPSVIYFDFSINNFNICLISIIFYVIIRLATHHICLRLSSDAPTPVYVSHNATLV